MLSWTGDPGNCGQVLHHLSQPTYTAQKIFLYESKNLATNCQKNPAEKKNQMDHVVQKLLFFTAALFFNSFESNSNPRKRVDTRLRFEMQSTRSHAKITGLPLCQLGPRRFFFHFCETSVERRCKDRITDTNQLLVSFEPRLFKSILIKTPKPSSNSVMMPHWIKNSLWKLSSVHLLSLSSSSFPDPC